MYMYMHMYMYMYMYMHMCPFWDQPEPSKKSKNFSGLTKPPAARPAHPPAARPPVRPPVRGAFQNILTKLIQICDNPKMWLFPNILLMEIYRSKLVFTRNLYGWYGLYEHILQDISSNMWPQKMSFRRKTKIKFSRKLNIQFCDPKWTCWGCFQDRNEF